LLTGKNTAKNHEWTRWRLIFLLGLSAIRCNLPQKNQDYKGFTIRTPLQHLYCLKYKIKKMQNQFSDLGISAPLVQALTKELWSQQRFSKNHSVIAVQHYRCRGLAKLEPETAALVPILQLIDTNATAVQAVILVPTRTRASNFEI
jgi:hypothetical protein